MKNIRSLILEAFYEPNKSIIEIDQGCNFDEVKTKFIHDFSYWCQDNLNIPNLPKVHLVDNRDGGITTGAYNPQNDEIMVYGKGRALVDIMRTLAHELTHYRQRLNNQIKTMERDWTIEGEADAEAGKMVYTFTHSSPDKMQVYEL